MNVDVRGVGQVVEEDGEVGGEVVGGDVGGVEGMGVGGGDGGGEVDWGGVMKWLVEEEVEEEWWVCEMIEEVKVVGNEGCGVVGVDGSVGEG